MGFVPVAAGLGEQISLGIPQVHSSDYDTEAVQLEVSILDAAQMGGSRRVTL
jgi:hypothetical protein